MPVPARFDVPGMSERAHAGRILAAGHRVAPAPGAAPQASHHEAQGLLLVKIQRIEEVPQGLDQCGHAGPPGLDLAVQQRLGGLAGEGVGFNEPRHVSPCGQASQGPAPGAHQVQQLRKRGLLRLAQVQEGADAGLQALAAPAIGTKVQAWAEAVSMSVVVAAPMACSMAVGMPVGEGREGPETGTGAGGQVAVGASIKVRAERTEPAIKAVVTMTFMVAAPATKQMHVAIPR